MLLTRSKGSMTAFYRSLGESMERDALDERKTLHSDKKESILIAKRIETAYRESVRGNVAVSLKCRAVCGLPMPKRNDRGG